MANDKKQKIKNVEYIHSFYSDLDVNDQFYACIIRSPVSSGTIRSINHHNLPQNYRIITCRDIKGINAVSVLNTSFPIFAFEKISYIGEPIGLMCGPDFNEVKKLIHELDIKYTEALNNDSDNENAMTSDQIIKHSVIRKGDINSVYAKSQIKLEKTYTSTHDIKIYKELIGCLVIPDKKNMTIFLPTAWACHTRKTVAQVVNLEEEFIVIKKTISSESSKTNLWASSLLAAQASIATQIIDKPVKLVLSRIEMENYVDNPIHFSTRFQAALEKSGKIIGITARVMVDTGAFAPFAEDIMNRLLVSTLGAYKIPHFQIEVFIRRSMQPPHSAEINTPDAHSLLAIELFIQEIARYVHVMPHEVRMLNIEDNLAVKSNEDDPEQKAINYPDFSHQCIFPVLEEVMNKSDFLRRYVSFSLTSEAKTSFIQHAPIRGIGIAAGFQGSGFLSSRMLQNSVSLEVTMRMDESVVIHAQTPSKNIQQIWKKQAARILAIPEDTIHLDPDSTLGCNDEIPETMSYSISTITALVKKCASAIQKMRFRQPLPLKVKRTIQIGKSNSWNLESFEGKPYHSIAWASAVIEVEINTFTYELSILSVWVTIDAGEILQPKEAELSIKKSIQLILSNSMKAQVLCAESISVSFIESTEDSKEIGNCMNEVIPAALLNAVSVALNKTVSNFPLNTDTIYSILTTKE